MVVSAFLIFFPAASIAATLQVSWNANKETDLGGYLIYYGTQSGIYSACYDVGKVTSYQITGVQSGSTCYIAMAAYDTSQNDSSLSVVQRVTVPVQTQQTAISLLSPVNGSVASTNPTFKWSGTGFKSYSVYGSVNNGSSWTNLYKGSGTSYLVGSIWSVVGSKATIKWYVQGTTTSGQVIKSSIGSFTKM
jgi:hypothetical protein